jgi:hypothetical protein
MEITCTVQYITVLLNMYCNVWLCNVQPSGSFGQIKAIYRQIWRETSLGGVGSHLPVLTVI